MKLFNKLFAEKILRFYEGTEAGIALIRKLPIIKNYVKEDAFSEKSKGRIAVGVTAQVFVLIGEFIRKMLYVLIFMFVPYMIMAHFFPLIRLHQDTTIIYLYVILSVICGSLANTTIFAMGDRDYLMIQIMLVSPYMNFLGKFLYKLATEFIFYFIILVIFRVPVLTSLLLCLLTAFSRPIGEMLVIIAFDHFKGIYENRNVINGTIMAICVMVAYALPVLNRSVSATWVYAVHPFVLVIMFLVGAGAMYFLWWYKYYRVIIRDAMHKKREF